MKKKAREWWMVMNMKFGQGKVFENHLSAKLSSILDIPESELIHIREILHKGKKK